MDINKDNLDLVRFTFQYCKNNVYITSKAVIYKFKSFLINLYNKQKHETLVRKTGRYLGFFHELGYLKNVHSSGRALYKKTELFPNDFIELLDSKLDKTYYRNKIFKEGDFKKMSDILDKISDSDFYLKALNNDSKALKIFYNMRFL